MATGWTQLASLKGPVGDPGPRGAQGEQGIPGPAGEDGAGIAIAGSVAAYGDLPTALTENDVGKGYLVEADGRLYIWTGTQFPANGQGVEFRGPAGPQGRQGDVGPEGPEGARGPTGETGPAGPTGPPGEQGLTGLTGPKGDTGPEGPKGSTGDQGERGLRGEQGELGPQGDVGPRGNTWFAEAGSPSTVDGAKVGDFYLDTSTGWVWKLGTS